MPGEYSEYPSSSSQKISVFNSTLAILMRIDILWKDAHRHSREGHYKKWNIDLDRVWCELASDASSDDESNFKDLNDSIEKSGFEYEITQTGEKRLKNVDNLYKAIMAKEIFLRRLQDKQGKGVKHEESVDEYMD